MIYILSICLIFQSIYYAFNIYRQIKDNVLMKALEHQRTMYEMNMKEFQLRNRQDLEIIKKYKSALEDKKNNSDRIADD